MAPKNCEWLSPSFVAGGSGTLSRDAATSVIHNNQVVQRPRPVIPFSTGTIITRPPAVRMFRTELKGQRDPPVSPSLRIRCSVRISSIMRSKRRFTASGGSGPWFCAITFANTSSSRLGS
jgi:hypothetical protein